ncbi:Vitamin B12 import ATP-binding protein BtuD [Dyadobacter sp. CECT 9275]|uniref:Vitamin B12 import ATP-binding protein BtuD n=1 Tax=Dyadobacter helix TaxID=2822344 RepID=A0A916NM38_9BACT|nr:ATP-binding cassette domain-containing protein [Dyadobacter sp. CECT 9275]CAG5004164.1 Vitamin B12 import ATP-binding protein BtuD [Dyadobacter sp. CECT 9275]
MNIIDIQHITKDYASHRALDDVSIQVPKGCIFGLLGPNGAGKTSLIRIVNQITGPDQGQILFDGKLLNESHISRIGYLPEERGLYKKMKVGEQLLYLAQLKGLSQKEAMEKLKVWFVKFDIKSWWDKTVSDLSKGMQQKVQFVSTVLHEPDLIILDEPFSGFDPINANLIRDEILELKQKGSTIIFSTHRMETVEELCDHIALIHKSKKVLDGPKLQIKEDFKTNTYFVEYRGIIDDSEPWYTVRKTRELESNYYRTDIHLSEGVTSNDLLKHLVNKVEIRSFGENIPTMSEIFMKAVNEVPEA